MGPPELLLLPVRLAALLAGLLLPGAALLRALRLPLSLAASFMGSAAILYLSVVALAIFRLPVTLLTLGGLIAVVSAALFAWSQRLPTRLGVKPAAALVNETSSFAPFTRLGVWTPLYMAFWGIVLWRLATQPLTGADIAFRWSWLAEQIVHLGSLNFYPPRSAADYSAYAWPESIPPAVASLHAWAYLCGGAIRALWTSPGVLLQLLALHEFVWRLAFAWGGEAAGRRAVLLAAATPLLTWSSVIGQETALTALAVGGLLYALQRWQSTRAPGWLTLAAMASVAAAGAREYGPAFPLLGLVVLWLMRAPRAALLWFAGVAVPLAALWPLRTGILTGNPFFSIGVAGIFATNPVFTLWSAHFHTTARAALLTLDGWQQIARYVILFAPAALFGGLALILHLRRGLREARWCAAGVAGCALLWVASVPFTAGGLFYSMRVLTPVLALTAAFGGYAIMAAEAPARRVGDLALLLALLGTLPLTLTLPENAYRVAPREWPDAARRFELIGAETSAQFSAALLALPGHDRILTDYAGMPRALVGTGVTTVPFWSPEVAWLFDEKTPSAEVARRWRASGIRYVVTSPSPPFLDFLHRHARWTAPPFALLPVWNSEAYVILEVIQEPPAAK